MHILKIFINNEDGEKTLVATCKSKEKSKLEELGFAITKADCRYSCYLIDLDFEELKKKVINLCNKNAGLEITFSALPNKRWLGFSNKEKTYSPLFSLERTEVTLRSGEKQSFPTKCILLYGISNEDLILLFENNKEDLRTFYNFILKNTFFIKKIIGWLRKKLDEFNSTHYFCFCNSYPYLLFTNIIDT